MEWKMVESTLFFYVNAMILVDGPTVSVWNFGHLNTLEYFKYTQVRVMV